MEILSKPKQQQQQQYGHTLRLLKKRRAVTTATTEQTTIYSYPGMFLIHDPRPWPCLSSDLCVRGTYAPGEGLGTGATWMSISATGLVSTASAARGTPSKNETPYG